MVESGFQPLHILPQELLEYGSSFHRQQEYGLKMNWVYDGRRDVLESTKAATYFLSDMHRHFRGNWLLAIASYNTGAGNVGKAINKANNIFTRPTYWDLKLPRETELYVPRLLALSKKFQLEDMVLNNINRKYKIYVNSKFRDSIDFKTLSIITGISQSELVNLNPGYSTWIIDPSQQNTFLLPTKAAKVFRSRYNKISNSIYESKVTRLSEVIACTKFLGFIM